MASRRGTGKINTWEDWLWNGWTARKHYLDTSAAPEGFWQAVDIRARLHEAKFRYLVWRGNVILRSEVRDGNGRRL